MESRILSLMVLLACTPSSQEADTPDTSEVEDTGTSDAQDTGDTGQIEVHRRRSCDTTFSWEGSSSSDVRLAGEWSAWSQEPMTWTGSRWELAVDLQDHLDAQPLCYKLVVDGEWVLDPSHRYRATSDGVENSGARVLDCGVPGLEVAEVQSLEDGLSARVDFLAAADGAAPEVLSATLIHDFVESPVEATWVPSQWALDLELSGPAPGKYNLRVEAMDSEGRAAEDLLLPFWVEEDEAFSWEDGLLYMVMLDRFANGDPSNDAAPEPTAASSADWQGGDLAGLTQVIDSGYLDELGVTALWLTPLNQGAAGVYADADGQHGVTGYHGYWPIEPRTLDPRLGTPDELEKMVSTAHAHGIRVLMDLVVNHVHEDHAYYLSHPEWFNDGCICGQPGCDWTDERLTCLFAAYMPDVDWRSKEASETLIDDALWWLETYDLDGARIDAVKHVDDGAVFNLSTRIEERFETAGTDYYLDGETAMGWAGDDLEANASEYGTISRYIGEHALDGQFDFVLFHAVVSNVFFSDAKSAIHLDVWTGHSQTQYPQGAVMTPYVGSHDTSRVVSLADYRGRDGHDAGVPHHKWPDQELPVKPGEDQPYQRVRAAFCWLLTTPGAPLVYMGDEYGEYGGGDPDNRHMWRSEGRSEREQTLLSEVRTLGSARAELRPLRRGSYRSLGSTPEVALYVREDGSDAAVVAVNISGEDQEVSVDLAGLGFAVGSHADELDFGGGMEVSGSTGSIAVPARSCGVYVE